MEEDKTGGGVGISIRSMSFGIGTCYSYRSVYIPLAPRREIRS